MLIDFMVENYRSYAHEKFFRFTATPSRELQENCITSKALGTTLLKSAAIYGPNGSGKSNLLSAMHSVSRLVGNPFRTVETDATLAPFRLTKTNSSKPSRFAVRFLLEDVLFEYSIALTNRAIKEERLVAYPNGRSQTWFERKGDTFHFNSTHLKGPKQLLKEMVSPSSLLLAIALRIGHPQLSAPANWIASNLQDRFGLIDSKPLGPRLRAEEATARKCKEDALFLKWVSAFLRHADVGIRQVFINVVQQQRKKVVPGKPPADVAPSLFDDVEEHYHPYFVHPGDDVAVAFALQDESHGTRRLFGMLAPFYHILKDGELGVIDELSASMHPSLVRELIRMFHDPKINPKGAQLLFATHDTALLSGRFFRRDQVWFTEKDNSGSTDLYSLSDIKGVREDEALEKGYLRGRYGAIPYFGQFDFPAIPEGESKGKLSQDDQSPGTIA